MDKNLGHHGPWIIEGLGYAGSLAAWYQHVYPDTGVVAVWASSAPLNVQKMHSGIDEITYQRLNQETNDCLQKANMLTYDIQRNLTYGTDVEKRAIMRIFTHDADKYFNLSDFMLFLSDIYSYTALADVHTGVADLCQLVASGSEPIYPLL